MLRNDLEVHSDYFSDSAKTASYLHQGESPADARLNPLDLAAYASTASLMLNLDETITKE